jgi:hypothetical protein
LLVGSRVLPGGLVRKKVMDRKRIVLVVRHTVNVPMRASMMPPALGSFQHSASAPQGPVIAAAAHS